MAARWLWTQYCVRPADTPTLKAWASSTPGHLDSRGYVKADAQFQTEEPSIFALGDMTGGPQLTPVAIAQAMAFAHTQFGNDSKVMDYEFIPTAVFCQPNIGTVGLTEEAARDLGLELQIFKSDFKPMKHTLSGRDERTLMKLIVDKSTDRVISYI